jgi:hypothetical protein
MFQEELMFSIRCMFMFMLSVSLWSEEIAIPSQFQQGESIKELILILDVDGVVRSSTEGTADPRVIQKIKSLLENKNIHVTFISGTPIINDLTVEPWRRGNVALSHVFGSSFEKELAEEQVTIYGLLGGHRMKPNGDLEVLEEYPLQITFELGKLLLHAFLKEVLLNGNVEQQSLALKLQNDLSVLRLQDFNQSPRETAIEFSAIMNEIRQSLDPHMRLLNNGTLIETHTSNPPWNTAYSSKWLHNEMETSNSLISSIAPRERRMSTGLAKKGDQGFNFLLISKTNKGLTTKKHIEEKRQHLPHALVVTIGDTLVDYPMHNNAHLAFHVGLEQVWRNNPLPHCIMIRSPQGADSQHIEGTLQVLQLLEEGFGKSFYDLKYIPKQDAFGQWNYYSLRDLQLIK